MFVPSPRPRLGAARWVRQAGGEGAAGGAEKGGGGRRSSVRKCGGCGVPRLAADRGRVPVVRRGVRYGGVAVGPSLGPSPPPSSLAPVRARIALRGWDCAALSCLEVVPSSLLLFFLLSPSLGEAAVRSVARTLHPDAVLKAAFLTVALEEFS